MRLCQVHCQENKRKVPESPLLTAPRGGLTVYATPWSQKRGRYFRSLSFFRQYCGPVFGAGFWPYFWHFWDHERANRSCSTVLTARISSICWRQPSFCNASRHGHTHPHNTMRDMVQKLFWISEKCPLSGAARSHANLLRFGSVPPLQRFCQEAVLRASWEKCVWRALVAVHPVRTHALEYSIVCGQSPKRDVIPYLQAGLRGVIGTYEGRNHRWEGRNPLFTCRFEGRNRDVRGA